MGLIKCNNCGKNVSTNAAVCPNCKNEIKDSSLEERNVRYLLNLATGTIIFGVISAIIKFIDGMSLASKLAELEKEVEQVADVTVKTSADVVWSTIIWCVVYIASAIMVAAFIRWCALLLKNIHELNLKTVNPWNSNLDDLVECPDCHLHISNKAKTCPHCAAPIETTVVTKATKEVKKSIGTTKKYDDDDAW